jgi:hypothetical protein
VFGSLEIKSSHEILSMRTKYSVIISLDDDGGTKVSVQWAGRTERLHVVFAVARVVFGLLSTREQTMHYAFNFPCP